MKPYVVALAADAAIFPAAVFLAKRLAAINPRPDDTEIVLFSDAALQLAAIQKLALPVTLRLVEGINDFRSTGAGRLVSGMALLRLFMPELLSDEVRRILYIDIDTYPERTAFFSLFDLDMRGHAIAATRDVHMVYGRTREGITEIATTTQGPKYLQSGVLLIDRAAFLAADLRHRVVAAAIPAHAHDQAAINMVLRGDWLELSPAMNMTPYVLHSFIRQIFAPSILHFCGKLKPWDGDLEEWRSVRRQMELFFPSSPWPSFLGNHRLSPKRLSGLPSEPPAAQSLPASSDMEAIRAYIDNTEFADVSAGITVRMKCAD